MVATTFTTSGAVLVRAGKDVNVSGLCANQILTDFAPDVWITQAESFINSTIRYNFTDNYSTLNVDTKKIIAECAECWAAIPCVTYDMDSYTLRTAEDIVNVLNDRVQKLLKLLQDKKVEHFIISS